MLHAYFKRTNADDTIPKGSRIYTTLQPCLMCAGMIARTFLSAKSFGSHNMKVYYGQPDKGAVRYNTE